MTRSGAAAMIFSPISVCRRMRAHSSSSSAVGLLEDHVRDRHLADVVELGGLADHVDVLERQRERHGHGAGQLGDVTPVRAEVGVTLAERTQQNVSRLAGR